MPGVSIRPSDFVEGGAVPVDKNLLWKECRFNKFDYTKKDGTIVATTIAAKIRYVDDDGQEYDQQYSAADPAKFAPNEADGGKTLVALTPTAALAKSSNLFILMQNLESCGFPMNRIPESGDISVLDGLYTFNIGQPEPNRSGLKSNVPVDPNAPVRARVISVPSQILRMPWDKKPGPAAVAKPATPATKPAGAKPATAPKAAAPVAAPGAEPIDTTQAALDFVAKVMENEETITRQQLGVKVFKDLAKDPNRDAIAKVIYAPDFQAALMGAGYVIDGENISKAE